MTTETTSYGEWASPIAGADVARKQVSLAFAVIDGSAVWWQESRPEEGGRVAVVCQGPDGVSHDRLPMPYNARTRVHEYGGRSYQPVPGGFVFANFGDQRLYRCGEEGAPEPLSPEPGDVSFRFADFVLSPGGDEIWCVRERHSASQNGDVRITRAIAAVPLDGSAAQDDGAMRVLASGSDFYAFPAPSPDGTRLAWICWDHPLMPWDGTELRVAAVEGDGTEQVIMGGPAESVLAPAWRDEQSLYVISDRSGWWNLYVAGLDGTVTELCPRPEEFAAPLWQLGASPYTVLGDGRLAVTYGTGEARLGVLDPGTGQLDDLDLPYRVFIFDLTAVGQTIATIAGGPTVPTTVISVDVPAAGDQAAPVTRELSRSTDALPDPAYLPVPRAAELTSPSGSVVHALVYPPSNPAMRAPEGERPPYIVWVHGGPTAQSLARLDLEKAFFTSRGIGIIDVNYGGSTGYGRAYRDRLRGQWGVVDVADAMTAALALAESGEADGKRLGIRGGSAGGWTALAAVTSGVGVLGGLGTQGANGDRERVFAAVASYFGVADLRAFAEHTHDFESRYLDGLIGPLPESAALYAERAPVGHVNDATCPVLLLQGLDDPVVPPAQAESIAADLAAHGIPYAYITYAGESHGFRKAENIVASMEAELSFYGQIMGFVPPGIPPVSLAGG
jgi:dipeptidyl aminopeptidase/acylaminoacyl peptidase